MTFDAFIEQAGSDHGEHPAEVAARLEGCAEVLLRGLETLA